MNRKSTFRQLIPAMLLFAAMAIGSSAMAQTFSIQTSHDGNTKITTFTITRTGSSLPAQTINFRTVNLSAYAGEHYKARIGTRTFAANQTTDTVKVREKAAADVALRYRYQGDTYRNYRFEVLDVNGFELAHNDRTITYGNTYKHTNTYVNSSITDLLYFNNGSITSGEGNKYLDVAYDPSSNSSHVMSDGYIKIDDGYDYDDHTLCNISTSSLYGNYDGLRSYLSALGYQMYATLYFTEKEEDDGYQYIQILADNSSTKDGKDPDGGVNDPSRSIYKACFELSKGTGSNPGTVTTDHYQVFPHRYDCHSRSDCSQSATHTEFEYADSYLYAQKYNQTSTFNAPNSGSLVFLPTVNTINVRFDANGKDDDTWYLKNLKARLAFVDANKPTLLSNVANSIVVSNGPHINGNTFYITVSFNEIVHISGAYKKLYTTWGDVTYLSGDYTNVITFKGTINASAGTTLAITGMYNCLFQDLAGNYDAFNENSFNKTFTGVTCTATYTLAATNTSFAGLANEYVVNTTAIEPHPTVYFYKGEMNNYNRVKLTETTNYTLSWANNTAAGNGTVTTTGAGSYTGAVSTTFPIRWSSYTFQFHGNGSIGIPTTGSMNDQVFDYGVAQNLTANAFSREGFTFAGWNTQPDGSGQSYSDGQEIIGLTTEDGAVIDLYAQWTIIPWTGSGDSEEDPYVIMYPSQLDLLASNVNGGNEYNNKFFKLGADITYSYEGLGANESNYTTIGTGSYAFHGTFDGNNKTISGIRIYTTYDNQGVFRYIGSNGTVKNVILANSILKGNANVGGIAGRNNGILTNCRIEGSVEILPINLNNSHYHGGITGENIGTVSGCISAAIVDRDGMPNVHYYGGIVGENSSTGTVKDCLYTGSTVDANNYYGAIAGINKGILTNNYYTTEGIWGVGVGQTNPSGNDCDGARRARVITLDENIVLVGDQTAYSLSGLTAIGNTALSYNDGNTTTLYSGATQNVKLRYIGVPALGYGCTGYTATNNATVNGNTLTMPDNNVSVSAIVSDVWGVTNTPAADGTEAHPYIITNTTGLDLLAKNVNGIDGYTSNSFNGTHFKLGADITYSYEGLGANESNYTAIGLNKYFCGNFDGNNKTISGIRIHTDTRYQGIFGEVSHGTVKNVILANSIIVGAQNVGGIIGETNHCTVTNCRVENDVTIRLCKNGVSYHGGIVGQQSYGTISGCVCAATLTDGIGSNFGGIAGNTYQGTIKDCIFIGTIYNGGGRGSIVGTNNGGMLTNNYYTSSIGGVNQSDCNGARRARVITLGENIALAGNQTVYSLSGLTAYGTTALSYNNGTTTTIYSGATQNVALSYTGTINTGYNLSYTYDDGSVHAISGNILEMPASDVTVSSVFTDVWGVTNTPPADGSSSNPYMITSTAGLDLLAKNVNGTHGYTANDFNNKHFKLGDDIEYSYEGLGENESNYTAIGYYEGGNDKYFRGTFDGDNKTISGIRIYTITDCQGIFGYVNSGNVKNVVLSNSIITGGAKVGGIIGFSFGGTVTNCRVESSVTINAVNDAQFYHGGIVGQKAIGTISGCISAATVSDNGKSSCRYYGGIVGSNQGNLKDCLYTGSTVTASSYYGSIAGDNSSGYTFANNYYTAIDLGGVQGSDCDGARRARVITFGENLVLEGNQTAYNVSGLTAMGTTVLSYNDGNATTIYSGETQTVSFTYTGTVPEGYLLTVKYNDGSDHFLTPTAGVYSFTMPEANVSVSYSFTPDIATYWHADADHDGTSEARAYIITTTIGLNMLAREVNTHYGYGGYFKLGADIEYDPNDLDANGENYTAIGCSYNSSTRAFEGTFDGCGHTVSGIRINRTGDHYETDCHQGLFGYVYDCTIKNVTLSDADITGHEAVGGIVGICSNSIIENCHVTSNVALHAVQNGASGFGGIVGLFLYSQNQLYRIDGCTSAVTLTVADGLTGCMDFGGIAGSIDVSMQNCRVIGATIPTLHHTDQYYDVDVSGAIAGRCNNNLSYNYYNGVTIGGATTGIGVGYDGNSYPRHDITENDGAVNGYAITIGEHITATSDAGLTYSGSGYCAVGATITLSAEGYDAVFTVKNAQDDDVPLTGGDTFVMPASDVTVTATLTVTPMAGSGTEDDPYIILYRTQMHRLVGTHIQSGTYYKLGRDITYSYEGLGETDSNYSPITVNTGGHFDGDGHIIRGIRIYTDNNYIGLFDINRGTVKNVTLSDAVITGRDYVGGIVGSSESNSVIENCHVTSTVKIKAVEAGSDYFGGIAGIIDNAVVDNCTSAVSITADGYQGCTCFGGIVGYNGCGTVYGCIAIWVAINGSESSDNFGGIVGKNYNYQCASVPIIENCIAINCAINGDGSYSGVITGDREALLSHNYYRECIVNGHNEYIGTNEGDINNMSYSSVDYIDCAVPFNGHYLNAFSVLWNNGTGTEEQPYIIRNCAQLDAVAQLAHSLNTYFPGTYYLELGTDIRYDNMCTNNYTPIGDDNMSSFRGVFDGKGHVISGIRKNTPSYNPEQYGLFEYLYGTVKNVILEDVQFKINENYVGCVVGFNNGRVENCLVIDCAINGDTPHFIVGYNSGSGDIINSYYYNCTNDVGANQSDCCAVRGDATTNVGSDDNEHCIVYNNVVYAPYDETIDINLSYNGEVPTGYAPVFVPKDNYNTALSGTSNPYTLSLNYTDVTIAALLGKADVHYLDEDGVEQICPAALEIVSDNGDSNVHYYGGWYVVNGYTQVSHDIEFHGNAHLIISDGACISANGIISPNSLTIYEQSDNYNIRGVCEAPLNSTDITINGCVIYRSIAAFLGDLVINSGIVMSNSISAQNITLGWRSTNDLITVNSYSYTGTLQIKEGQIFSNGPKLVFGTITDLNDVQNHPLVPFPKNVAYIDKDGETQYCTDFTVIESGTSQLYDSNLGGRWYIVYHNTQLDEIAFDGGDIHIILMDGSSLNLNMNYHPNSTYTHGLTVNDGTLYIYGQTNGTGCIYGQRITNNHDINVYGGRLNVAQTMRASSQNITFKSGVMNIGSVTARTVFLGWLRDTDRVTVDDYSVDYMYITNGKAFHDDDDHYYYGTLTRQQIEDIEGKTLIPFTDYDQHFAITYHANGGTLPSGYPTYYTFNTTVELPVPTREGYAFIGWFDNDLFDGTGLVEIVAGSSAGDINLYALWGPESTKVRYVDENFNTIITTAKVLYGGVNGTYPGGVYTILDYRVIYKNLSFTGNTTLILPDSKIFGVADVNNIGNSGEVLSVDGDLTIYGQEDGHGYMAAVDVVTTGDVIINGGAIEVLSSINANNGNGTISLNWTGLDNEITVHDYNGHVIAERQFVIDKYVNSSSIVYTGTVAGDIISDRTLHPYNTTMAVSYLDENNEIHDVNATVLWGDETNLGGGVYSFMNDVTFDHGISFDHDATIIIPDGVKVTFNNYNGTAITVGGKLSVYGQLDQNGQFTIHSNTCCIDATGDVTLCNMVIGMVCNSTAIHSQGNVLIVGYSIINGISANNITLGYHLRQGSINSTTYTGTVKIRDGQSFYYTDGENEYTVSGTLSAEEVAAISNRFIYPDCDPVSIDVEGYGDGDGKWMFIASPVAGSILAEDVNGLIGHQIWYDQYDFDLYRLNPSTAMWENFHQHDSNLNPFVFENGKGYLYANMNNATLDFYGAYNMRNTQDVALEQGWNLVGNPFTTPAYINRSYYKMNAEGTDIEAVNDFSNNSIPACIGVVVRATGDNETVTFTKAVPSAQAHDNGSLQMTLTKSGMRGEEMHDKAIVSFNAGTELGKYIFNEGHAKLYIPQAGADYAIAYSDRRGEMPLNFKAKELGTYTITLETDERASLQGVHLIDILACEDIDLSENPTYTFIGSPADRQARFIIRFNGSDNSGNSNFAYQNGDNLVITGEGTLQVFDVMGRMVMSQRVNGVQTIEKPSQTGVYILKLKGKTQKIVVR